MAIFKRLSYERHLGRKVSDVEFELYQLRAYPLSPSESQEERNQKIMELMNKKNITCEKFICEWVYEFVDQNWDKMEHKKCDLDTMGKKKLLKDVKKDVEWALWVINEVMNWAMDENYSKELIVYDSDEKDVENFKVIKLIDKYIKILYNKDFTHTVSFVEPKTKTITVTYFE
jgi:hypothetical protein